MFAPFTEGTTPLILLNCDSGECNDRRCIGKAVADILRISLCKVEQVKKRFMEDGQQTALSTGIVSA